MPKDGFSNENKQPKNILSRAKIGDVKRAELLEEEQNEAKIWICARWSSVIVSEHETKR